MLTNTHILLIVSIFIFGIAVIFIIYKYDKDEPIFNIAEVVFEDISDESQAFDLTKHLATLGWDITTRKEIDIWKVYGRKRYIINKKEN